MGLLVIRQDDESEKERPRRDVEEELLKFCDDCHEKACPSFNGCDPATCKDEAKRIRKR